ncbi:fluoride efflux transporter CrcB [Muricauda sp. JGD-17]|uniref:Fluoride-specific ion channel FluC n=1 Tax=Flagellimonas ochracea TaxID=2696472 RepID=A0A964T9Y1_9FLAO|nr:fluoride efflux transporter CrcB [Allomuricauda ochracea]NAY90321.1 fluoride efflux transporter CrcB [Allomuricauda ochracea]
MKHALLVFLGGGFGSLLRFVISKFLNPQFQNFFLGTFLVNVLGCLLIGVILGLSERGNLFSLNTSLFLATGFCGGFTTFSAFAFEQHTFLKNGELFNFSFYTISSLVLGVLAVSLGFWLTRLGN